MRIKTVTIGRTKNLGNFNSAKCEVTIEVEDHESAEDAAAFGKDFVMTQLGIEAPTKKPDIGHPDGKGDLPEPRVKPRRRRSGKLTDHQGDEPEAYGGSPT